MTFSTDAQKTINSQASDEHPLVLLTITHSGLSTPVRVVNDNQDLVSNSETFTALGFAITLADQPQTGVPQASLQMDNVGKILIEWLESSQGGRGASCQLDIVFRSRPDDIEFTQTFALTDISANPDQVTATLSVDSLLDVPGVRVKFTPAKAPSCF